MKDPQQITHCMVVLEKKKKKEKEEEGKAKVEGRDMETRTETEQRKQPLVHTKLLTLKKVPSPGNKAGLSATENIAQFWNPGVMCVEAHLLPGEKVILPPFFPSAFRKYYLYFFSSQTQTDSDEGSIQKPTINEGYDSD